MDADRETRFYFVVSSFIAFDILSGVRRHRWDVMVVAAAVMQALAWAARGFAGSLYDGPNGMELAIFNDLCFCSLRSESGPPCLSSARHTGHPAMNNPCQMSAYF